MPRCQQRNRSRLRRASSPSLDRVDACVIGFSNAKSPDGAGRVHIASRTAGGCQHASRRCSLRSQCAPQPIAKSSARHQPRIDRSMRPPCSIRCLPPLTSLPGVGPKQDKLLRACSTASETPRLVDLLFHLPVGRDRPPRAARNRAMSVPGTVVTLEVTVDQHRPPPPQPVARALSHLCQRRHRRRDR